MSSKGKYAILLISSVLVIYAIIGGVLGRVSAQSQNGSYQQLSIFDDVLIRIRNDYVDEPNMKAALVGAIRGLVENIDPYGGYLAPKEVEFYKGYSLYKTPGIGAVFAKPPRLGYPVIVSAIPGGSAAKAGLAAGDIIESIDGVTTREMNLVQIHAVLSTPVGKPAALSVIRTRRADPEVVNVPREVLQVPPVEARMVETNIAYVKIPHLGPGKAAEVRKQLDALIKKGATSVILDLRYAAGGESKEGLDLANMFVGSGILTTLKGQKRTPENINADPKQVFTKAPLAVIVNQGTAGAAELLAGAISDNARGEVVGVKTFGMASVQRIIPLEEGFGLLLSTSKYYTPSGKEIQQTEPQDSGIKPTVEVRQSGEEGLLDPTAEDPQENQPAPAVKDEDRQLNKAIEVLKNPGKAAATKKAA